MSLIRRALFLAVPVISIGCSDDTQAPVASETGGALIFGNGGSSGAGAPAGSGGASSATGGSSNGGTSNASGGSSSTGGSPSSDGGSSSGNGGAGSPSSGGSGNGGGGTPSAGGANPATGGIGGGGPTGLPVGSLCANDSNCAPNICCKLPACGGPCECQPASNCPTSTQFLPCNNAADCSVYGGGKICCRASSGGQTMQYCTKSNGCPGTTLP